MKYAIEDTTLTGIANAIRERTGNTAKIPVSEMRTKIRGLTDTSDATVTAYDVPTGLIAYGADGKINGSGHFAYKSGGTIKLPGSYCSNLFYHSNQFVAQCDKGVMRSTDGGCTWELVSTDTASLVVPAGDGFMLVSDSMLYADSSWTFSDETIEMPSSASLEQWLTGTHGNGTSVIVGYSDVCLYAADADVSNTWSVGEMPTTALWRGITYGNGRFVAVGDDNSFAYSVDNGATWVEGTVTDASTAVSTGETVAGWFWNDIVCKDSMFVAVGSKNVRNRSVGSTRTVPHIAYSTNGEAWTIIDTPIGSSGTSLKTVACDGNRFIAMTNKASSKTITIRVDDGNGLVQNITGTVYVAWGISSEDGTSWVESDVKSYAILDKISYGSGVFIVMGDSSMRRSSDGTTWSNEAPFTYGLTDTSSELYISADGVEKKQLKIVDGELMLGDPVNWAGELTFSGTNAGKATHYTEAGCSLAVDPVKGMAFVTIQGGTSSAYEHIRFTLGSKPDGVEMLPVNDPTSTSATVGRYYTAVFTGITGKVNVDAEIGAQNTSSDYVPVTLTMTYA